ncbi:MAG TPA: twin-arginine translocase TatA/TatE family subunit [Tepidisphaeraceae bacterium]|nr:twin-arginine translocase TatA/TatE family subunit [Tepidisphaeraceae bacterium]
MLNALAFQLPSTGEWLVIGAILLLFYSKRPPNVGGSIAGAIVNFKKGLKALQDEIDRR